MAKAIKVNKRVPAYDTSDVVLTLSSDEAIALRTLFGAVAGCPTNSLRVYTAAISSTLDKAGVDPIYNICEYYGPKEHIRMKDGPQTLLSNLHKYTSGGVKL